MPLSTLAIVGISIGSITLAAALWRLSRERFRPRGYFAIFDHLGLNVWPGWYVAEATEISELGVDPPCLSQLSDLSSYRLYGAWLPWQQPYTEPVPLDFFLHRRKLKVTHQGGNLVFHFGETTVEVKKIVGGKIHIFHLQTLGNYYLLFSTQPFSKEEAEQAVAKVRRRPSRA